MKIAVIGWYGTETIGDRAILAGLMRVFSHTMPSYEWMLGSIYPFFTERTLSEDGPFLNEIGNGSGRAVSVFHSANRRELVRAIDQADLLVVGGGPLMGLSWMYLIEYAICHAHRKRKKIALLGCGVGPLRKPTYVRSLRNIVRYAQLCAFRDIASLEMSREYLGEAQPRSVALIDPAVFCADYHRETRPCEVKPTIAVNMREYPQEYGQMDGDAFAKQLACLRGLGKLEMPVRLVPMHYFGIGGDDRLILNRLVVESGVKNAFVDDAPLNLEETMGVYAQAAAAVGMRFHSVVLQTILNGNNYILDYTGGKSGKTAGFIRQLGAEEFYKPRTFDLRREEPSFEIRSERFSPPQGVIEAYFAQYCSELKALMNL